jgi:hypothetical protein
MAGAEGPESNPRVLEFSDRLMEGLRQAGLPEK